MSNPGSRPSLGGDVRADAPGRPIMLLLVDDAPDISAAIARAAKYQDGISVVGTLQSTDGLVDEIQRLKPDVVLLDLSMEGEHPLLLVPKIGDATRVVVFSGYDDYQTRDEAMRAGVWGFVSKSAEPNEVFAAIRSVAKGVLHGLPQP